MSNETKANIGSVVEPQIQARVPIVQLEPNNETLVLGDRAGFSIWLKWKPRRTSSLKSILRKDEARSFYAAGE